MLFSPVDNRVMHTQMERLYQAARELKGIKTPTELARALNQSPQTIKNWESRGISMAGMIKAQGEVGCSVTWLETGNGPMELKPHASEQSEEGYELVRVNARERRLLTMFMEANDRGKRVVELAAEDAINSQRAQEAAAKESPADRERREGAFKRKIGLAPTLAPEKQRKT